MDLNTQFVFRNNLYVCVVHIDSSAYPCLIFVILTDKALINEFGDEITIKTDCEKRLPRRDDYAELVELREAIFDAVKTIAEFMVAKARMMLLSKTQDKYLTRSSVN